MINVRFEGIVRNADKMYFSVNGLNNIKLHLKKNVRSHSAEIQVPEGQHFLKSKYLPKVAACSQKLYFAY